MFCCLVLWQSMLGGKGALSASTLSLTKGDSCAVCSNKIKGNTPSLQGIMYHSSFEDRKT